ncbi:MAG: hypothetical protein H6585_05090 [Flavobacteriales bacterium]|nr:hypothetical protein [Flavobacteriales bacterium]MCB9447703.1 hypothetical protein [Flavobacteriales bacterium]
MRRFTSICIGVFFLLGTAGFAQVNKDPYTYYLGFSLKPQSMGTQMVSYFLLKYHGSEFKSSRPITRESFILQIMGLEDSPANPEHVDWFEVYEVKYCKLVYLDSAMNKKDYQCPLITQLWKLRYEDNPFFTENGDDREPGWGKKMENGMQMPSPGQMAILRKYGIKNWFDVIKGEDMYRLLHDLCDDQWIARYQAAR